MRKVLLLLLPMTSAIIIGCQNNESKTAEKVDQSTSFNLPDSLSSKRISFVLGLRKTLAEEVWEEFGIKKTEGTFIYFNKDKSEIFFPSQNVLSKLDSYQTHSKDYILSSRTDSIPYHFEFMISFDPRDSVKFYHDHPVQQFLSTEETSTFIPSVKSTEMWSTMVIHEMFHHFQYNNEIFKEYAKSNVGKLPFDIRNLMSLCKQDSLFMEGIQSENNLLLAAIDAEEESERIANARQYLSLRKSRIGKYQNQHPHLEQVENYYTIQEGSARYVEYQSMLILNDFATKSEKYNLEIDPMFDSFKEFQSVSLKSNDFNYLTYAGPNTYHYALGFNLMRLLDKMGVEYKAVLLNQPNKGLHEYLEIFLQKMSEN